MSPKKKIQIPPGLPPDLQAFIQLDQRVGKVEDGGKVVGLELHLPAPPPIPAGLNAIPEPPADFTGRVSELQSLLRSLVTGENRAAPGALVSALVSGLSGGAGVGKTALARLAARYASSLYPHARLEIDLKGAAHDQPLNPAEAQRAILQRLLPEARLPDDETALHGLYLSELRAHACLLLLDNARGRAQVKDLLPPPPSAAIVTSRYDFDISQAGLQPLRLDVLPVDEARALLVRLSPKLERAAETDVDSLGQLCGRLPLALRVAGAKLRRPDASLERYLLHLQDERTRLGALRKEGDPDLDVQAALNLTYKDLPADTQARFRALGVFPAPFVPGALAAVWDGAAELSAAGESALEALLEACLLDYREEDSEYALHDLTRLYALNLLLEQEEEARRASQRHADYYLEQGRRTDELVLGVRILEGLQRFGRVWPHLQAAWERMSSKVTKGWLALEAPEPWLVNFTDWMIYALGLRLAPRRRIPYLQASLEAARETGDRGGEGVALGNLGVAYLSLGEPRRAIEYHEQWLVIARETGNRRGEGNALGNLGNVYADLGEPRRAIEYHEQALVIARETGDRRGEGNDLGNLGLAYAYPGEPRRAIEYYELALVIARQIGYRRGEGNALGNQGLAYADLGEPRRAIEYYEQALVIARETGDRRNEGAALSNQGIAYRHLGEPRREVEFYEQALVISRETGDRRGEGASLTNLGNAYAALGEPRRAIEYHEQALVIDRETGDRGGEGIDLGNLGNAYADQGEPRRAIEFYEQRLVIAREIGDRRGEGRGTENMAYAYQALGDLERARSLAAKALEIYIAIEDPNAEKVRQWLAAQDAAQSAGG